MHRGARAIAASSFAYDRHYDISAASAALRDREHCLVGDLAPARRRLSAPRMGHVGFGFDCRADLLQELVHGHADAYRRDLVGLDVIEHRVRDTDGLPGSADV
jgi:hypothetical protein